MGTKSFIEETGQFHKVRFEEGLVDLIFSCADCWPSSRPSVDSESTPGHPYQSPLMCMLPLAGGPSLLEPHGFRSSWGEEARRKADFKDLRTGGVTPRHRVGRFGPRGYRILVIPWPCPELCVLAQSDLPGGRGGALSLAQHPGAWGGEGREKQLSA